MTIITALQLAADLAAAINTAMQSGAETVDLASAARKIDDEARAELAAAIAEAERKLM
jgi:hypothetical protein